MDFGWTKYNQEEWDKLDLLGLRPARVIADFGTSLKVVLPQPISAELSGKLAHYTNKENMPKVGDWVAVRIMDNSPAVVESVVVRRNEIARKIAGKQIAKQIIAANIDIAFVLLALDTDFSVERLERFLYQLSIDKIETVIVLNKSDKTDDIQSYIDQLISFDLPIIVGAAINGTGVDEVMKHIFPGRTAILLGSSGVGKSTLTNKLLGRDVQQTNIVKESDSTGKHTTVHRELFVLPNGGLLIDTPGIRELQLWGSETDLDTNYQDIIDLASRCKYTNCQHVKESGCAIRKALQNGALDKNHYANYLKMKAELAALTKKHVVRIQKDSKRPRKNTDWQRNDEL
jgi:ribosome biogenesis GTPase